MYHPFVWPVTAGGGRSCGLNWKPLPPVHAFQHPASVVFREAEEPLEMKNMASWVNLEPSFLSSLPPEPWLGNLRSVSLRQAQASDFLCFVPDHPSVWAPEGCHTSQMSVVFFLS